MPVGMETDIQIKATNGQVSVDEAQGIVECFVAAIGNKDSVGDIIQPGAFTSSLLRRKPRVVWGHNWNDPIGKVLDIQEVGPSDPRLPEKMKAGGVGGLYARVQFNLGSEKGREAFANVAFFGADQEWSIGYKTINATFDPVRQANILREVELYECSPVLHGANQLTGTISVKGADAALLEHEETHVQTQDDLEFSFDDFDEKMCGQPHPPGHTEQHDRKLELELMSRSPQPIKLINASDGVAIFQVRSSDDGPAVFQIHYHYHPERGFLLGRPERVVPQVVYAPVHPTHTPPAIRMKPQVDPAQRYRHNPNDTVMPRIMRIVQKFDDGDEKQLARDELIISCRLEDAFATKSLLDPIIDYHGAVAEVTEEGIIIKSGATPDFIEAVETATKALGRGLRRGLPRGGGGLGKVRRAGRALQRFDPNAIDADLDMIVQEGTPWERPATPGIPSIPSLPRSRRTRFDAERRKPSRRGLRSVKPRRLLEGRNWDEEELPDVPTPEEVLPEGTGIGDRIPSKQRIGDMSRSQYEDFRTAEAQKIIKAYGIEDVSDPLYPHPALTHFSHFDHTELVPMSFFQDMPGNRNNDGSAARAGEMRDFEVDAPIIMGKLDELTEDIRANGIKEALIVRYNPETGDMHLDEGNHRLAAAERLGLQTVPVRMLKGTEDRRGIAGPRKQIERARTNARGEAVDARGEYLGESFRPSSVQIDTEKTSPEMRRLQMMVAARGGSRAQANRREERRGLPSRGLGEGDTASYRGMHTAPTKSEEGGDTLDSLTNMLPLQEGEDNTDRIRLYGSSGSDPEYAKANDEMLEVLDAVAGKPDEMITVYRAVPRGETNDNQINPGDWVSPSPTYAAIHGEGPMRGDYSIASQEIRAGDLVSEGNSLYEFGFDPDPDVEPVEPKPVGPRGENPVEDTYDYGRGLKSVGRRNEESKKTLEELGGHYSWGDMTLEERRAWTEAELKKLGWGTGSMSPDSRTGIGHFIDTDARGRDGKGRVSAHIAAEIERLEEQIKITRAPLPYAAEKREHLEKLQEFIDSKTPEELHAAVLQWGRELYDDPDNLIVVMDHEGPLEAMLGSGVYRTTHTNGLNPESDPDTRAALEVLHGYPANTPEGLRPASGLLVPGAMVRRMRADLTEKQKRTSSPDPLNDAMALDVFDQGAGAYGPNMIILRPEVKDRSRVGAGDSLNDKPSMAPMVGATDAEIVDALISVNGSPKAGHTVEDDMIMVLERVMLGLDGSSLGYLGDNPWRTEDGLRDTADGYNLGVDHGYHEVLIHGSFTTADIQEVVVRSHKFNDGSDSPTLDANAVVMGEIESAIREAEALGLSPEDVDYVKENLTSIPDEVIRKHHGSMQLNREVKRMQSQRAANRDRAERMSYGEDTPMRFRYATRGDDAGIDFDDPKTFGTHYEEGDTLDDVIRKRRKESFESLAATLREPEERRGLASRQVDSARRVTRYDLRAREVADPKRLDGAGRRRSGGRGEVRAGDTPIWDRQKQWNRETRRVAGLRSSGYNENEIASVMDPPRRTGGGLASRNFHNQSAHDNLRELTKLREQLLDFLEEHPDFDPHLPQLDESGVARVGTADVADMPDEWHELMDEFDELHQEYKDKLDMFRAENEALGEAYEKRQEVESELRGLDKDLKSEISQLDELSPVTDDRIREFLEADDLDGFMTLFTPEYLAERNSGTREGDTFYDLEATEANWYNWEYEVRAAWRSAQDARTDIQDAEQRHYGAEQTITQHSENGDSEVLEAVELLNGLPLDTRASMQGEMEEQGLTFDPPAISPPPARGLYSKTGRGLGEDREIDTRGSSAVSHLRHDGGREELVVSFRNGETYVYGGVDSRMANRIEEASSIGRAINDLKADADYVIKPDGTVDGLAPTLSSRIVKHKRRLDGTRGLTPKERDLFDLADGGAGEKPIPDPGERTKAIKDLHDLADDLFGDGEPAAASILRDAAAAIRSDPRRRVNAHHSGKVELTLTDDEIGEISDGLRSAVSKHAGRPNIERGLTLYDRKLSDAKGGKVTFDTAEYNSILEAHARLELINPDDNFKPGRDVLELAAASKKGKWESPNLSRAEQRPDLRVGFASRRPNNGAPQDITPRLQGDLVYWARQQGGFRVVQELVRRYDRDREQLSPRDWIRLHDYYANHSPAGRGMAPYGGRRGLRSQGEAPKKRAAGAGRKVGSGEADKFVGRKWEEVRPSDWNEMSLDEQSEELITNHSPNRDSATPKSERLRQVDYDRITDEIRQKQQGIEERNNPELRRERQREERAERRAERIALAREKGATARPIGEDKKASKEKKAADNAEVAMERRKKVVTALNRLVGRRRDEVSKAVIDDRADPTHGEFWDSLQDMLATTEDGDFKFNLIEGLAQRVDDYLEDSTGAELTDDENDSLSFATTLRERLADVLEEYEADEFIDRGDVVPEEEGVVRPVGPQGDDPDDPTGTARVSREYDIETTQQQRLRPGLASRRSQRTEGGGGLQSEGSERLKKPEVEDAEGLASRSSRAEAQETRRLATSKERGAKARTRRATQRQKQKEKYVTDLGKKYRKNREKEQPGKLTSEDEGVMGQLRPVVTPWSNQRVNQLIIGDPPDATEERRGLASRSESERTPFDGQSSFFKIVYDSLGKEIREAERDDDSSTAGSLKKLKKNFEYFDKRSIKYGPKHPKQTDSGTVEIDNEDLPDIIDALFRALDRQMKILRGKETSVQREEALLRYLSAILDSAGVDPEMETMEPIRVAAISKFIEMLSHGAMDLL